MAVSYAAMAEQTAATSTQKSNATTSTTSSSHHSSSSSHSSTSKTHVDINSASKEQLMTLPGIDEAKAMKIVQERPYKSKSDLVAKGIVDKAEYGKIESHVTAKQPASTTAAKTK